MGDYFRQPGNEHNLPTCLVKTSSEPGPVVVATLVKRPVTER